MTVVIIILSLVSLSMSQEAKFVLSNSKSFPIVNLPYIDNQQLRVKNDKNVNQPFKYAEKIDMKINIVDYGEWTNYNEEFNVWRLNIVSKDAIGIKLLFDEFLLPKGSHLYIYNELKDMIIGPIGHTQNKSDSSFGHKLIKGDSIYIELFIPNINSEILKLQISHIIHAFEDILGFDSSQVLRNTCGLNVSCSESESYLNEINSVGYLVMNQYICTGALINNTRQDLTPYFLTAYHCVFEETELGSHNYFTFYFRHQSLSCSSSEGNYSFSSTGSNTLAWGDLGSSDFALLRLDNSLPSNFNAYYAGWSRVTQNQTVSVGIHHPSGNPKKINFDNNDIPYHCGWFNNIDNTHWCLNWDEGGTEGGSSGSPLFNGNHQIIGQLSGGDADCGGTDLYGKISHSWDGLDSSYRLKDWLDPDNTNTAFLDGTSDGIIDYDGDHIANNEDLDDNNPYICSDLDEDGCDDCSSGSHNINNDGLDFDNDGLCDLGDDDDDNDGSLDSNDINDTDIFICSDLDQDGCDDCSSGYYNLFNDGCQYADVLLDHLLIQDNNYQLGVYVNHNHPISGFQFRLISNPGCINLEGTAGGQALESDFQVSLGSNGMVLGFSLTGATIISGDNLLTNILLSSDCDCNICAEEIILTDSIGMELIINDSTCNYIDISDIGDINQDFFINISDIVLLIDIILEQYQPTSYEINLSDINNDNYINVGDVVSLVELIIN